VYVAAADPVEVEVVTTLEMRRKNDEAISIIIMCGAASARFLQKSSSAHAVFLDVLGCIGLFYGKFG
jgi:hypothetical protein